MFKPKLKGDVCPVCDGKKTVCYTCFGLTFENDCYRCYATGIVNSPNACIRCRGRGEIVIVMGWGLKLESPCSHCHETGIEPGRS